MKPGRKLLIILLTTVCFWGGLFYCISCCNSPDKRAMEVAERALRTLVDNPESIQIKGISKAEPVFGKEYVNPHEKAALSMHLMKYGQKLMEETDYLQKPGREADGIREQLTRQLDAMTTLRTLIAYENRTEAKSEKGKGKTAKPFNGWKVKIDFEAKTPQGKPYHSEYWFILDKKAEIVVKLFEIPLL
ncbi:hypothetical protein EVA_07955 [gut metagenome]|uniref:Uncharacterized protein n=1 Tax=gut metagenome TaxID=749906 RepID=J9G9I0_9ZZZZ